jgi:colanic acid/amylovoran biosynthesis protein
LTPIRICLLWHGLDSGNLGVRALTESQLHLVSLAASKADRKVTFEIVGWAATESVGHFKSMGVAQVTRVTARSMVRSDGVRGAFGRCDLVLDIGEGDSFADIYGAKRLLYFSLTKMFAIWMRRPLILSPQTIGPFSRWWSLLLSDLCLNGATYVFPRDELSRKYLESRKLRVRFSEIVDVAFALPYEKVAPVKDGVIRVGINVSGLLWAGGYTQQNQFGLSLDYPALVRRLVSHFVSLPNVEVFLVPHVISDPSIIDSDSGACKALAAEFPRTKLPPPFEGPSSAKSFISGLDFFVGARMHACIAAFSAGVPVVPLAYSRKFKGLFNTLGYSLVADCQSQAEQDVFELVLRTYQDRALAAAQIAQGNDIASKRLAIYVQMISEEMAKL